MNIMPFGASSSTSLLLPSIHATSMTSPLGEMREMKPLSSLIVIGPLMLLTR
jgi:hypothetical protein